MLSYQSLNFKNLDKIHRLKSIIVNPEYFPTLLIQGYFSKYNSRIEEYRDIFLNRVYGLFSLLEFPE